MNILITGGSGFLGMNLLSYLSTLNLPFRIKIFDSRVLSNETVTHHLKSFQSFEFVKGDIRDGAAIEKAFKNSDVVVHLAAQTGVVHSIENPEDDFLNNSIGTFRCLEACRKHGIQRFIFASSGAVFSAQDTAITEDQNPFPQNPYGAGKAAGEGYCHSYAASYGIETVVLRFSNVYGPYSSRKRSVAAKFIQNALKGEPLVIYGRSSQCRDFIFAEDIARAIHTVAAETGPVGGIYHVATNKATSIKDLAEIIKQKIRKSGLPDATIQYNYEHQGGVEKIILNSMKFQKRFFWKPSYSLEEGIEKTIAWYINLKSMVQKN